MEQILSSIVILLVCVLKARGDCNLSLKSDFGIPSPVYIRNGAFLAPDSTGAVVLRRSETLVVACPGDGRRIVLANQTTSYNELEAHCILDGTFRVDRWIGLFRDITCSSQPWFSSEEVGACEGGNRMHRVGYKVKSKLHSLYQACFNADLVETLYVQREMTPASTFIQTGLARPQFSEGGLFGKVSMSSVYKVKNQINRVNQVLGTSTNQYISDSEYLTRGHLAARADFNLFAEQRASFHYVNTAPQWRKVNAGAWAALEDGLRRRINVLGRPVTVYTGPLGLSQVGQHPFYLTVDKNNNGLVPVPMYFYKLVYDALTKTAVAFISINSSALNSTAPPPPLCDSACDDYPWLKWRGENACCAYEVLEGTGPLLQVTGLLKI